MKLKRKIFNKFRDWKNSEDKVALLVMGARQVGKTTSVREFGRREYQHLVEINFEETPSAKEAFSGDLDANTIIQNLSLMGYGPFVEGKTLVFFDEIQSCPQARTAIKFLVDDGRYDYIESGSLLGINYRDVSSYPVGFEDQTAMYPLDFEEFLWAKNVNESSIEYLRGFYERREALPEALHQKMLEYYRQYLIVGGMPAVVAAYISNSDFSQTLLRQKRIISNYRDDIAKYAGQQKAQAKQFFDSIPAQLARQNKRFVLNDVETGAKWRKYQDAAEWIQDAGIACFSYNIHSLELPLEFQEKRNMYKVFLHDTGLLCALWGENIQYSVMSGNTHINEGALTENFVAAELSKHGYKLHYYDRKSRQELDFVLSSMSGVRVIEVKSGKDYKHHASLTTALQEQRENITQAVVVSPQNISQTADILYLPLYMTMFL